MSDFDQFIRRITDAAEHTSGSVTSVTTVTEGRAQLQVTDDGVVTAVTSVISTKAVAAPNGLRLAIQRLPGKPIPRSARWRFLSNCLFNPSMLEKAASLWREPLDQNDLQDIEQGIYLFENKETALSRHLNKWADENPEKLHQLTGR